jgi:hypothetical protein
MRILIMSIVEELKDFPGLEAAFHQMVDDGVAALFSIANSHYLAVLVDNRDVKVFRFDRLGLYRIH